MLPFVTLTAVLTAFAFAFPYQPETTVRPPVPKHEAHFENCHRASKNITATASSPNVARAKGGYVTGGVAREDYAIGDGIEGRVLCTCGLLGFNHREADILAGLKSRCYTKVGIGYVYRGVKFDRVWDWRRGIHGYVISHDT